MSVARIALLFHEAQARVVHPRRSHRGDRIAPSSAARPSSTRSDEDHAQWNAAARHRVRENRFRDSIGFSPASETRPAVVRSNVEQEVANITILHYVALAFNSHFASSTDLFFVTELFKIF